jgi:superfamily I DNA and RNA helicase
MSIAVEQRRLKLSAIQLRNHILTTFVVRSKAWVRLSLSGGNS